MAFPTVESITETSFGSDRTSFDVSMPATVTANDLLLLIFSNENITAQATPANFTEIADDGWGNQIRTGIYLKVATGSEGGTVVTCSTSAAESGAAQVYRITGWNGATADVEISTGVQSSTSGPNGPSITASWGSADNLFLNVLGAGDDDESANGGPAGWTFTDTACGAGSNDSARVMTAYDTSAAATGDPGAWSLSGIERCQTWTLVIRPGTAGGGSSIWPRMAVYKLLRNL